MFKRAKQTWRQLKNGTPGKRFQDHYQSKHPRSPSKLHQLSYGILGFALVVGGAILSIPPGVPGALMAVVGIAVISSQSARAARGFDWLELRMRDLMKRLARREQS